MRHARLDGINKVTEIFVVPSGTTINDCFVPIIAEQFIPVSDEVDLGWELLEDGTFKAPEPVVIEETPTEKVVNSEETPTEEVVDGELI